MEIFKIHSPTRVLACYLKLITIERVCAQRPAEKCKLLLTEELGDL